MTFGDERINAGLVFSLLLHGTLLTLVLLSPRLFPSLGTNWGSPTGGTGGISVKMTGSISGVPLPSPPVVQESAPANDSPGLYKSEEAAPAPPDKTAEPIPEPKA